MRSLSEINLPPFSANRMSLVLPSYVKRTLQIKKNQQAYQLSMSHLVTNQTVQYVDVNSTGIKNSVRQMPTKTG